MLRLLLRTSLCSVIALSLFGGLASAFGTTLPPNPAMQGFVRCLFTHCPDVLPLGLASDSQQVLEIVTDYGYQPEQIARYQSGTDYMFTAAGQCDVMISVRNDYGSLSSISFSNCPHLRLGDLLTLVGDPWFVALNGKLLAYGRGAVVLLQSNYWFSWDTPVISISLLGHDGGDIAFAWEGVMPRRYYCQSQPYAAADTC